MAKIKTVGSPVVASESPVLRCSICKWWLAHFGGETGNCIAEPPGVLVQVQQQVPIYHSQEVPLSIRGQQFCVHRATAAAERCRLFEPTEFNQ